jgi:hypothetical protein
LKIAGRRRNCPLLVVKHDLGGLSGQRFHHPDAVLRMAQSHSDMERFDSHVVMESNRNLTTKNAKNRENGVKKRLKRARSEKPIHDSRFSADA